MAYYFMVEKRKGIYQPLFIDKAMGFTSKRKYTKEGAYTLQEIDMFTMGFTDLGDLKKMLLSEGILPRIFLERPLSIRYLNKGEYKRVPHDFLYQKDINYVCNPTDLMDLILDRYYSCDFEFVKQFANYFCGYRECSSTAPEVRAYVDIREKNEFCDGCFDEIDKNGDDLMTRLVKLLLLEHTELPNGVIDYTDKVNYRNLHTIIAFINNYDMKHDYSETCVLGTQMDMMGGNSILFDSMNDSTLSLDTSKVKVRKRTRKDEMVPGQISLFDCVSDDEN